MQSYNYRLNLTKALRNLVQINEIIHSSIVDVSMQGELKEFNDSVPIGEVHQLDFDLFRNSDDINIQLLVKLMRSVDETYESIKNLNNVDIPDELEV